MFIVFFLEINGSKNKHVAADKVYFVLKYTIRSIVCEDPVIMSCYSGIMSPSISNIAKD